MKGQKSKISQDEIVNQVMSMSFKEVIETLGLSVAHFETEIRRLAKGRIKGVKNEKRNGR